MGGFGASNSDEDKLELWYALGRLYARAGGRGWPATRVGVTVVCITGALVLLSAPVFGTAWISGAPGPVAALPVLVPILTGLLAGGAPLAYNRVHTMTRQASLRRALARKGADPRRPTADGLEAYYDDQLILLRSEYEALLHTPGSRARRKARMLSLSFGFAPEDPFESGPLNLRPDSPQMRALRGLWESRLYLDRSKGVELPALSFGEDLAYRVFPREMTVPAEFATRTAYLAISCDMLQRRYGQAPLQRLESSEGRGETYRRAKRDLADYERITLRRARRRPLL
ncbi:MAG: hypothetical protein L0G70_08825 [Rubrobacter sp.]|nr:hypothetical protein [Rubrobacter sp.]